MAKKPDIATSADGVGADRCTHCGAVLRHGGEPMVAIRRSDVEQIACILYEYVDCPEVWGETITRLERAVGRTVRQMKAEQK